MIRTVKYEVVQGLVSSIHVRVTIRVRIRVRIRARVRTVKYEVV
jgi:hypothetical protein